MKKLRVSLSIVLFSLSTISMVYTMNNPEKEDLLEDWLSDAITIPKVHDNSSPHVYEETSEETTIRITPHLSHKLIGKEVPTTIQKNYYDEIWWDPNHTFSKDELVMHLDFDIRALVNKDRSLITAIRIVRYAKIEDIKTVDHEAMYSIGGKKYIAAYFLGKIPKALTQSE